MIKLGIQWHINKPIKDTGTGEATLSVAATVSCDGEEKTLHLWCLLTSVHVYPKFDIDSDHVSPIYFG